MGQFLSHHLEASVARCCRIDGDSPSSFVVALLEFFVVVRRSARRDLAVRVVVLRTVGSCSGSAGRRGESASTATLTDNGGRALDLNALHHPGQRDTVPDEERVNVRALVSRVGASVRTTKRVRSSVSESREMGS
jgi:hypothetical protein